MLDNTWHRGPLLLQVHTGTYEFRVLENTWHRGPLLLQVHTGTYEFRVLENTWHRGPLLLTPRYNSAAAALGSELLLTGGQDATSVLGAVEKLDAERGWVPCAPLATPRKYHAAACVHRCASTRSCARLLSTTSARSVA